MLGEAIDLEPELEAREKAVGTERADILCRASEVSAPAEGGRSSPPPDNRTQPTAQKEKKE